MSRIITWRGEVAQSSDLALCSTPLKEAVPLRSDRSIHAVPPSVNGLVQELSVTHLRGWTGSFAERLYKSANYAQLKKYILRTPSS